MSSCHKINFYLFQYDSFDKEDSIAVHSLSCDQAINRSLSALGNVISALSMPNAGHIPYRDNKLTLVRAGDPIVARAILRLVIIYPFVHAKCSESCLGLYGYR